MLPTFIRQKSYGTFTNKTQIPKEMFNFKYFATAKTQELGSKLQSLQSCLDELLIFHVVMFHRVIGIETYNVYSILS